MELSSSLMKSALMDTADDELVVNGGPKATTSSSSDNLLLTNLNNAYTNNNNNHYNNSKDGGLPKYSFNRSLNKSAKLNSLSYGGSGCTIVAIIEGKGSDRGQIGVATMDIRHSDVILCQFVDTASYSLLRVRLGIYEPVEIILPEDKEKTASWTLIMDVIQQTCPKATVTPILRRYFNDALGIELIKQYFVEECSQIDASVFMKYYCMSAVAALIKYVEYIQNVLYAHNSLRITYVAVEDSCMIDVNSWKSLDLIHMDVKSKKGQPNSLFEILNCCVTPGGMKTLKSHLLQPSANVSVINQRLDVVQELVSNQALCDRIRTILGTLGDLQQLISICTFVNVSIGANKEESKRIIRFKITQTVALKTLLEAIKQLSEAIEHSKSPFFVQNKAKLNDGRLNAICELVDSRINADVNSSKKRKGSALAAKDMVLFAVAEQQHILLDLARRTYQELVERIMEFERQESTDIPEATLNYSQSRGYHYSMHTTDPYSIRLPPYCIQIVFNKTSVTFTTRDLIKYNDRLVQSETEILQKSNLVLDHLLVQIREFIPALYNCAELISSLDFYAALACYSSRVNTCRPTFGECIEIRAGRHPILDYRKDVVPNSTFASHESSRFSIIAGPNMAGKSTYMRQVCLLQILAQMGCLVPAESACFLPITRIFSRVGHNDDLVRNLSGFSVEMSEMATIMQNADHSSLIIVDELARSTSTEEGIGICYAICERLLSSDAIVFFATHFLDMAQFEDNYPGIVKNYHFTTMTVTDAEGNEQFAAPHQVHDGAYRGPLYGLDLAELTTFPAKILTEARELAERLQKAKQRTNRSINASSCTLENSGE